METLSKSQVVITFKTIGLQGHHRNLTNTNRNPKSNITLKTNTIPFKHHNRMDRMVPSFRPRTKCQYLTNFLQTETLLRNLKSKPTPCLIQINFSNRNTDKSSCLQSKIRSCLKSNVIGSECRKLITFKKICSKSIMIKSSNHNKSRRGSWICKKTRRSQDGKLSLNKLR